MKIVIDIPDEDYKFIKDLKFYNSGRRSGKTIERNVINGIKNGKLHEERLLYIEDVFRLVEGHSIYSGDSILSAFTCLSEGRDIKDITPLDVSFAEIADLRRETHNE